MIFSQNIKRSLHHFWTSLDKLRNVDITSHFLRDDNDISQILNILRNENPSNKNFCYLNINSVRSKSSNLQKVINRNGDIVSIAETKVDAFFPSAQVVLCGYHLPYCMDVSCRLTCGNLCDSIQAIPFEINLRKEKWLLISVSRPPTQDREYFLSSLTKLIDLFCIKYDNYLIMGDFNMELTESALSNFLSSNNLLNLMKEHLF